MGVDYDAKVIYGLKMDGESDLARMEHLYPDLDIVSIGFDDEEGFIIGTEVMSAEQGDYSILPELSQEEQERVQNQLKTECKMYLVCEIN
jgi:hypothetical protein